MSNINENLASDQIDGGIHMEEQEAKKAQWTKEAKALEQYIYDTFYDDKDSLADSDYNLHATYLLENHKDEYQEIVDNINLSDFAELQKEIMINCIFYDIDSNRIFNAKLDAAIKHDLASRLSLINPADYQESNEDIKNNNADNRRGAEIEAEINQ